MSERPHKKLELWNYVMEFVTDIYKITEKFPFEERYGLTAQLRRAVVSIASNIAEGSARKSISEKIQFYSVAKGSLSEIDAQLEIPLRLNFLDKQSYQKMTQELGKISRMLQGLINSYEGKRD